MTDNVSSGTLNSTIPYPASRGSAPSTLRSPKQQIWLRTALCGGWCRRTALRNLRVACQKWRRWRFALLLTTKLTATQDKTHTTYTASEKLALVMRHSEGKVPV